MQMKHKTNRSNCQKQKLWNFFVFFRGRKEDENSDTISFQMRLILLEGKDTLWNQDLEESR